MLSYIDCGSVTLASKVWDWLCTWVFVPFFEIVLAPLWWIIIGWLVLIFGRCAWLAGLIWAHTIGYVLDRVGHVVKAVQSPLALDGDELICCCCCRCTATHSLHCRCLVGCFG